MEDKRLKDSFNHISDQKLRFTKEDRNVVFERIDKMENYHTQKKSRVSISKQITIITASLSVVGLFIFLFIPSLLQGDLNDENSGSNASGVVSQENEYFTTLFMVKDEENRIPINLLLTYNKEKNMMKVLSIPRDTYAPMLDKNDESASVDKLSHAYINASGVTEKVRATVSSLFDLKIDYYAVIDLETFSTLIDSVNGIEYNLEEDIRVRAISQVAFEFKKGENRLDGEEVLALIMDATYGRSMDEEDQVNLINAVIEQAINVLPQTQFKQITTKIESNFPIEQLIENKIEIPSIQSVSLIDGIINSSKITSETEGIYYAKFEKEFLNSVTEELTRFN